MGKFPSGDKSVMYPCLWIPAATLGVVGSSPYRGSNYFSPHWLAEYVGKFPSGDKSVIEYPPCLLPAATRETVGPPPYCASFHLCIPHHLAIPKRAKRLWRPKLYHRVGDLALPISKCGGFSTTCPSPSSMFRLGVSWLCSSYCHQGPHTASRRHITCSLEVNVIDQRSVVLSGVTLSTCSELVSSASRCGWFSSHSPKLCRRFSSSCCPV